MKQRILRFLIVSIVFLIAGCISNPYYLHVYKNPNDPFQMLGFVSGSVGTFLTPYPSWAESDNRQKQSVISEKNEGSTYDYREYPKGQSPDDWERVMRIYAEKTASSEAVVAMAKSRLMEEIGSCKKEELYLSALTLLEDTPPIYIIACGHMKKSKVGSNETVGLRKLFLPIPLSVDKIYLEYSSAWISWPFEQVEFTKLKDLEQFELGIQLNRYRNVLKLMFKKPA